MLLRWSRQGNSGHNNSSPAMLRGDTIPVMTPKIDRRRLLAPSGSALALTAFRRNPLPPPKRIRKFGIDGARFLRSVALGYDIGPRVTITLGKLQYMVDTPSQHARTFRRVRLGRRRRVRGGISIPSRCAGCSSWTAQQASGLASWQRDTDHIEKAFDFAGMPARNGVTSALMVAGRRHRRGRYPFRRRIISSKLFGPKNSRRICWSKNWASVMR